MDKKAKKRIDVLHQRVQQLRQKLAGAKKQEDEPGEVKRLEQEIAAAEAEIEKLKAS
jgi:cell division septum initiation protein DivIVA